MPWKIGGVDYDVGDEVECEVSWRNGRKTVTRGKLITIDSARNEAYIDSALGPLAGHLDTLELIAKKEE